MTTTRDSPESDDGVRLVVRVWLPDRPGALGLVASRIGAIGADIVGVDVLERSEHVAVDEFAVVLSEHGSREAARTRDRRGRRRVGRAVGTRRTFPDARLDALETVERVFDARRRGRALVPARRRASATSSAPTGRSCCAARNVIAAAGDGVPDALGARRARGRHRRVAGGRGRRRRTGRPRGRAAPANGVVLLVGRDGHPFRRRERHQLLALARIADRAASILELGTAANAASARARRARVRGARPDRARRRARGSARRAPRRSRRASTAACTAQPGSWSCAQSWNRHSGASASMSANARRKPSSATHSVTARSPGVSTSTAAAGKQHELARGRGVPAPLVVRAHRRRSPAPRAPTSRFTSVDLPTPDAPISATVRPGRGVARGAPRGRCPTPRS